MRKFGLNIKMVAAILVMAALNIMNVKADSALAFFRHMTVEEGLSSNQVRSIMQDEEGFVWVGTDHGLNRYDGRSFKCYHLPDQWKYSTLMVLFENEGVIWVGTDKGLFFFDKYTEVITLADIRTENGVCVTGEVNSICRDKDGDIWISTFGQGLFRYDEVEDVLKHYPFDAVSGRLSTVYVDRANQVWALTNWGSPALSKLNKATDAFESFLLNFNGRRFSGGGLVLFEDSNQRFWLGSWGGGLYEIDRMSGNVTMTLGVSLENGAGLNHIHSIVEYEPGLLLIGSDDGLLMYDTHTKEYWNHTEDVMYASGLSSRFVYPMMKDREGSLWVGTFYGGINYHSVFSNLFDRHTFSPYANDSICGKIIGGFCEDGNRNIWVASDDGGLSCYDVRTGKYRNYTNIPGENSLSYDNVHALCMDGDDLWIGTYTGGVNVLDTRTGQFRLYLPVEGDPSSIDGTSSYAIFKDRDGRIWVSTMNGINLYDREEDKFVRMKYIPSQIADIDQDRSGAMWFSTQGGGLVKYHEGTDTWTVYRASGEYGSLPGDYVNCGFLDSKGRMWFGTNSGLCRYNKEEGNFERIETGEDLSNICGIVEDKNVLWITTNHGLLRYEVGGSMHLFSTSNGLCSNQFIANSIFKASDGKIYAGTTNGFNSFYPYQIKTNQVEPQVEVISVEVDNAPVAPAYAEDGSRKIVLDHKDKSITLHYASLSFCIPQKNQYAYKLEGFDKEWNNVGNISHATYTNLPAGNYVFLVKGTNNDGLWCSEPERFEIQVRPHPLLSASFKVLYCILLVLLLFFIIAMVLRFNDKKHEKEMDKLEERKEQEVYEAKINFFTTIAHEIRTPLSLIIGPLENALKKADKMPEPVREDLKTVERNSQRLLYLVNQLLDFRKVEQDSMVMRYVNQPIEPLICSVCERFSPTINYNGSQLQISYPPKPLSVSVDGEALIKLISNLLSNACKYTKDLVKISCHLDPKDENWFIISVYDNGCGISHAEQSKIFLPFYQTLENKPGTGIGLSLVRSIAELHGGSIHVKSELGSFSEFIVRLPVYHDEPVQESAVSGEADLKSMSLDDILNMDVVAGMQDDKPIILVVDDNEEIVNFLSDILSGQYSVITACNGVEAWDKVLENPDLSLIIADWMMPELDGIGLCRRLRENLQTSHIPFVLLTAKTDDASKVAGMDCGADAYIEKPFSVQYLEACLKNLIAMREALRRRYTSSPLTSLTTVANNSMDSRFLQTMTSLIEENMSDSNLSVEFLTEQMGVSRSSFYNKIKSLTDSTPNELIQLMRLKRAAQLLTEHKYRINEICYMVGFNNPSYFSKCFAKQFGMKPGEFASRSSDGKSEA